MIWKQNKLKIERLNGFSTENNMHNNGNFSGIKKISK